MLDDDIVEVSLNSSIGSKRWVDKDGKEKWTSIHRGYNSAVQWNLSKVDTGHTDYCCREVSMLGRSSIFLVGVATCTRATKLSRLCQSPLISSLQHPLVFRWCWWLNPCKGKHLPAQRRCLHGHGLTKYGHGLTKYGHVHTYVQN